MRRPTQIVGDREDYLGQGLRDIGRRIAADQVELFVAATRPRRCCSSSIASRRNSSPLHDVGAGVATLHLLARTGQQRRARACSSWSIRRQGLRRGAGDAAVRRVAAGPTAATLRIYTTEIDADTLTRQQIATRAARAQPAGGADGRRSAARRRWRTHCGRCARPSPAAHGRTARCCCCRWAPARRWRRRPRNWLGNSGVAVRTTPQASRPDRRLVLHQRRLEPAAGPAARTRAAAAAPIWRRPCPRASRAASPTHPPRRCRWLQPRTAAPAPTTSATTSAATPARRQRHHAGTTTCSAAPPSRAWSSCCVFDLPSQQPLAHAGGAARRPTVLALRAQPADASPERRGARHRSGPRPGHGPARGRHHASARSTCCCGRCRAPRPGAASGAGASGTPT